MQTAVRQMIDCPFLGTTKRLYLQSKVFELMALQLNGITSAKASAASGPLKAETLARIYYAAELSR